jgi:hypothetical protein
LVAVSFVITIATSLEGPVYVGGTFYTDNNKLETLEGSRKKLVVISTVITTS